MRNKLVIAGAMLLLPFYCLAQSKAYFYNDNISQPTIEPIPNSTRYLVAETIYRSASASFADNAIHLVQYDQTGNILNEKILDEGIIDNRSVDLTCINANLFLLTSSYHPGPYTDHSVQLTLLDVNFNILGQKLIQSTNPQYADLIPADAVYDAQNNRIAICGRANEYGSAGGLGGVNISKAAFALTCNLALTPMNLKFYNTTFDPNNWEDYDLATHIVLNSIGKYYITGAENVNRGTGFNTSGIRNMLVDPFTLNITWSRPLQTQQTNQSSVDMFQSTTGNFITLINSTFDNYWHLARINPATGAVIYPALETFAPFAPYPLAYGDFAYNIMPGNATNEVMVSGMKFQSINRTCYSGDSYNKGANPFMATIDISTYPGSIKNHVEYYSLNGADMFWYLGGTFAPLGTGTNVPVYTNNFVDRIPGQRWGLIAPIKSPTGIVNTKFLDLNANTTNGCDDIICEYEFITSAAEYSPYQTVAIPGAFTTPQPNFSIKRYDYVTMNTCAGYHRPEPTAVSEISSEQEINVYPNPVSDDLTIDIHNNTNGTLQLLDIVGRVVYSTEIKAQKTVIDMNRFTSGMYTIKYFAADRSLHSFRVQKL